jgi:hypothetical protein
MRFRCNFCWESLFFNWHHDIGERAIDLGQYIYAGESMYEELRDGFAGICCKWRIYSFSSLLSEGEFLICLSQGFVQCVFCKLPLFSCPTSLCSKLIAFFPEKMLCCSVFWWLEDFKCRILNFRRRWGKGEQQLAEAMANKLQLLRLQASVSVLCA